MRGKDPVMLIAMISRAQHATYWGSTMSEAHDTIEVLFLCTGNSARSILAEVILNELGGGRFRAYSAGSHATGKVNPDALAELESRGHDSWGVRSKSWEEFAGEDAPAFDFIFTVCDQAANETCPIWSGHPMTVHWGIPDPAVVTGPPGAVRDAYRAAYDQLAGRIKGLVQLPIDGLEDAAIREALRELDSAKP